MKTIFSLCCLLIAAVGIAQTSAGKPKDATKQTDKSAVEMTKVQKSAGDVTPNDRSAMANGSLTVEHSNDTKNKKTTKRQIPDGTYGTNRTNIPLSLEQPNYPYDKDGKLIRDKNFEVTRKPASGTTPPSGEHRREESTKL